MPDYSAGKIYQIVSHQTTDVYIGSTTQALSKRMTSHRTNFKRYNNKQGKWCSSYLLLQYGDATIELIEECPCENKEQLDRREGQLIRERRCVNKHIAGGMTTEERKTRKKEWREGNKEKVKGHNKEWREVNKEKMKLFFGRSLFLPSRTQFRQLTL